ncbi:MULTISPECIES: hypothetical protein [Methylotenera]|uniref:hypothetical protein n=1 Tax=Methylotenera TaxID=359407 RepID=UPI0003658FB6|nr:MULTISPECIES: hypothetical protein [Methylotenera]
MSHLKFNQLINRKLINNPVVLWLFILLAITPSTPIFKYLIADSMAFHMLVQIPLLILAGYLIGRCLKLHPNPKSLYIILSCWLWFLFATLFWMLPISLDKALLSYGWDFFKIISLMLSGLLLTIALSSSKILSLFFIGSTVMMLFFIGYYYQDTTLRLCNSYLIESQQNAGIGLIAMAFAIVFLCAAALYKEA